MIKLKNNKEKNIIINEKNNNIENYFNFKTEGEIYSITFSNEDNILIIGDSSEKTYFYNIKSQQLIKKLSINTESVSFLSFSSDNNYLISASLDGIIHIFSKNYILLHKINTNSEEIIWLEWNPKGPMFAIGKKDGSIFIYLAKNPFNPIVFYNHFESTTQGKFSDDGFNLISIGEDGNCNIYDLKNKKLIKKIKNEIGPLLCMCLSINNNNKLIAVGSLFKEIQFISYEKQKIVYYKQFKKNDNFECAIETICFCFDNNFCVFSDSECFLNVFDIKNMEIRSKIEFDNENATKIIVSNIKNYMIYVSGSNGNIYLIDTRNAKIIKKIKMHNDVIMDFLLSKKEEFLISSSIDKTINYFNIK
jgi:WD40 repeat protein